MALGSESTNNNKQTNWREVVSTIKEAGKTFDKKEIDPHSLRYLPMLTFLQKYNLIKL